MRAPIYLLLPMTLPILLGACTSAQQQIAEPVAAVKTEASTKEARLAEIKAQIAKVCPKNMTPSELDRAAVLVERLARDGEVVAVVKRLFQFDSEARACRGLR
ncbi:MAG: hypothetical protein KDJ44_02385 [Rhodoblastus sp.]|nr:hypothetical protein [Rhodoblastus sp.]